MDFLKKWWRGGKNEVRKHAGTAAVTNNGFGSVGEGSAAFAATTCLQDEPASPSQGATGTGQQHHHRAARRATAAAAAAAPPPQGVLAEASNGEGGVQGLDWFRNAMLRDSDGDCAHCFLEEPSKQQPKQQQRGKQHARSRPAKQQKCAALQTCSQKARAAGPSDLILEAGNVFVVPHD
jgi:hypothetical protein